MRAAKGRALLPEEPKKKSESVEAAPAVSQTEANAADEEVEVSAANPTSYESAIPALEVKLTAPCRSTLQFSVALVHCIVFTF